MNTATQLTTSIEERFAALLRDKSGFELSELDRSSTFLELGFDSLFLIQLSQSIRQQLKVKVSFRQLIEDMSTLDALLNHLSKSIEDSVEPQVDTTQVAEVLAPSVAQEQRSFSSAIEVSTPAGSGVAARMPAVAPPALPPAMEVTPPSLLPATNDVVVEPSALTPAPSESTSERTSNSPAAVAPIESSQSLGAIPEQLASQPMDAPTSPSVQTETSTNATGTTLQQVILQQTALMSQHLALLASTRPQATPVANANSTSPLVASASASDSMPACDLAPARGALAASALCTVDSNHQDPLPTAQVPSKATEPTSPVTAKEPVAPATNRQRFGPYKPVPKGDNHNLTEHQQQRLDAFVERFTARTARSKALAETHRPHFADPRGVAGYRRYWKSMVYQIAVERSKGSKLWDIDGNEYVDIAMGFGLNLFGQSPDFVTEAIAEQLQHGVEVGPQSPLAGETARLLCELSRKERATFCCTGSEAVMAALRVARTVTGKDKCVFFNKDYHGNFDEVLLRSNRIGKKQQTSPAAPGIPQSFAESAIVLDYGTPEALANDSRSKR